MNKEFIQRILAAVVGIPILLYIFYVSGLPLFVFLGLVSIIGMWEYSSMISKTGYLIRILDIIISFLFYVILSNINLSDFTELVLIFIFLILLIMRFIIRNFKEVNPEDIKIYIKPIFGWFYTGFLPALIYRLGTQYKEQHYLFILLILIWLTDSAAYLIGIRFGKHRGIFPVSPKKSLEGFAAGIIVPIITVIFLYRYWILSNFFDLMMLGLSAGLIGQLGDLLESKLKRISGVKDSSRLIPGHGGILDRFDSLLLAAPVFLIIIRLFS